MPKNNRKIECTCELCGRPTGLNMNLGDLSEKLPNLFDRKERTYKHGMCAECKKDLEDGCVLFVDELGRCVKVKAEAAKKHIQKSYWGKVVRIPKAALQELIRAYLKEHPELTKLDSQLGNGES